MFVLVHMADTFRIPPCDFDLEEIDALKFQINKKFANKIIPDVGLGIKLYDIISVSEGVIMPGDGGSHHRVQFRLIVFRPFIGEVIVGKIKASAPAGLQVSVEFFDNIYITAAQLQEMSVL
jgi:DNA-directed RNA polymerase III subunit RPC8